MPDIRLALFTPHDVHDAEKLPGLGWDDYPVRFLAQGDSWFSIGAMPPWATSNLLMEMKLGFSASAVNCASPGRELAHMDEWKQDSGFVGLLVGELAYKWDGILLSGGGNDLIAAAAVLPFYADGKPIPKTQRLFLKSDEWGNTNDGPARYLSSDGWQTFSDYFAMQFRQIITLRDSGENKDVPLICHGYDYPMPRNAPASKLYKVGPWLYPSLKAYGIPETDWLDVATELINRLDGLILKTIDVLLAGGAKNIHFVDTRDTLVPADSGSIGVSHDWENEIHPSPGGYEKLAYQWRELIETVVPHG